MSALNGREFSAAPATAVARRRRFTIGAREDGDDDDNARTPPPSLIKKRLRGLSLRSNVLLRGGPRTSILGSTVGDDEDDDSDELEYSDESDEEVMVVECYDDVPGYRAVVVVARSEDESAADTVYWGWVVLLSAWVVFVVGMGSVMGVWEWAWGGDGGVSVVSARWNRTGADGEQKRWPRSVGGEKGFPGEFPIPGYYPALCILCCIMAWVWVVTAWVGMKYFKHAKIQS